MKVKNFKELIAACVISQCMVMMPAALVPAAEITPTEVASSTSARYKDEYTWYYKKENGKLYKRKYNNSAQQWVGDWIYVRDL